MTSLAVSAILGGVIFAVLLGRAIWVVRGERGRARGTPPGEGETVIRSEYLSGGGGGGEITEYRVPRDPQKYAQLFVPREDKGKDE